MAAAERITFADFQKRFKTEEQCREYLFRQRFPDGFVCPSCGAKEYYPIYENGQAAPTVELLRKYADYFDVSMDYIFARCDDPRGKLYENRIMKQSDAPELRDFIEMCFEPGSPMNERLKESLFQMMTEGKK